MSLLAEGTNPLAPNSTDITALYTNDTDAASDFNNFAGEGSSEFHRLHINISNPANEVVYFGFSQQMSISNEDDGTLITESYTFTIMDPNGNIVYGPVTIDASTANANSHALAFAGPAPLVGASGYTPFTYNPAAGATPGDYYIEFSSSTTNDWGVTAIPYWDITVADDSGSPSVIDGRIWSYNWELRTPSISHGTSPYTYYDRDFNGKIYTYTNDGFVNSIEFDGAGFKGLSFTLAFNRFGTSNTNDVELDRKSLDTQNGTYPQYKIFLNDPDPLVYPTGSIGSISSNPLVIDCDAPDLCVETEVTHEGQVEALLDLHGNDGIYTPNTADVLLTDYVEPSGGETAPYYRCLPWDGIDGNGNPANLGVEISIYIILSQGITHFPMYDVEYLLNGYDVTPIRPTPTPGFVQKLYFDDQNIADDNGSGDSHTSFEGCIQPCHTWSNLDYGETNTINTWFASNQVIVSNSEVPQCPINAIDDTAITPQNTSILVNVTFNDVGTFLDVTSVSTSGLLQPSNGTTSIDPVTGGITYTPDPDFTGVDVFEYEICSTIEPDICDIALVTVIVGCINVSGKNIIYGGVYDDVNVNGTMDGTETYDLSGVTVNLYEDTNANGLLDDGSTPLTTNTMHGSYSFEIVPSSGSVQTVSVSVSGDNDDAEEQLSNGDMSLGSTDLELISDGGDNQIVGMRFNGIAIPQGAEILNAYVEFEVDETDSGTTNLEFSGQDIDNAPVFTTTDDNISNRVKTTNRVSWNNVPAWNTVDAKQQTPDLSSIVQEIVDRSGWTSSNSMVILVTGNGERTAEAYDGESSNAPLLYIEYQISSYPISYITTIDESSLPADYFLTTDNLETATFTATSQSECNNDFGAEHKDPCDPISSGNTDSDSDGVSDICDLDNDNDGVLDEYECPATDSGIDGPLDENLVAFDITGSTSNYLSSQILNSITVNATVYSDFVFPDSYISNFTNPDDPHSIHNIAYGVKGPFYDTSSDWPADAIVTFQSLDLNYYHVNDASNVTLVDYIELAYDSPVLINEGMFVAFTERGGNNTVYLQAYDAFGNELGAYKEITENSSDYIDMGYPIAFNTTGGQQNVHIGIFPLDDLGPVGSFVSSVRVYYDINGGTDGGDGKMLIFGNENAKSCKDSDGDGIADYLDLDSDGDGCSDANEAYNDITIDGGDGGEYGSGTPAVDGDGKVIAASYASPATTAGGQNTFQEAMALAIATSPANQSVDAGDNVSFTASATATILTTNPATSASTDLSYQWYVSTDSGGNFSALAGENGTVSSGTVIELNLNNVTADMDANIYKIFFTNEANICGEETEASLNVNPCVSINLGVYLEGPWDGANRNMKKDLNDSHLLPGQDLTESTNPLVEILGEATPVGQPYDRYPWNFTSDVGDRYGDAGTNNHPDRIAYDTDVVDWVLLSVREGDSLATNVIWRCTGLLHQDGQVEIPSGCGCLEGIPGEKYYMVVEHRNHMPVMTPVLQIAGGELSFDFRIQDSWIWEVIPGFQLGRGQKQDGADYMMFAGNGDQDPGDFDRRDVNSGDNSVWFSETGNLYIYLDGDFDMNADLNSGDDSKWFSNAGITNTQIPLNAED